MHREKMSKVRKSPHLWFNLYFIKFLFRWLNRFNSTYFIDEKWHVGIVKRKVKIIELKYVTVELLLIITFLMSNK